MHNLKQLNRKIEYEGVKLCVLSYKLGVSRTTLWSRLTGQSEFTTEEIRDISKALHLNEEERKNIFNIDSSKGNLQQKRRPYNKRFPSGYKGDC